MAEFNPKNSLDALSTEQRNKANTVYKASTKSSGGLSSTDFFNAYSANRLSNIDGFSKIKTPRGAQFTDSLKSTNEHAQAAQTAIVSALQETPAYTRAKTTFDTIVNEANAGLKQGLYGPEDVFDTLLKAKGYSVEQIKGQHAQEKTKITNLFNDETFKEQMRTALNCSDSEINGVKTEMLQILEASQKEELQKFEKAVEEEANRLSKQAMDEYYRISFLADRLNRTQFLFGKTAMAAEILALAEQNKENANTPVTVSVNAETGLAILKNVDVNKLSTLQSISNKQFIKNADGSLSVQLNKWFRTDASSYEEMASLAQAIRAAGHTSITLRIDDPNAKTPEGVKKAEELGRIAYEAAILAGFDPKQITIEINSEPKHKYNKEGGFEKNELFKDYPSRYNLALEKAQKIETSVKNYLQSSTRGESLKARFASLKAADEAENKPTAAPAA